MSYHLMSVRVRIEKKLHRFKKGKPLCGQTNAMKDSLGIWKCSQIERRCKKCEAILKRKICGPQLPKKFFSKVA